MGIESSDVLLVMAVPLFGVNQPFAGWGGGAGVPAPSGQDGTASW